jgi:hypothetical protein
MEGVSQTGVLTPHLPPVSQSDTEPVKYKESYSRLVILYNNTHAHTHKSTLTKCIL